MLQPSIKPTEICQSEVHLNPLTDHENVKAIKTLKQLMKTSIGNKGRLKLIQNASGGHVSLTSSSSRLLHNISFSNNFLKFIVSSVKSHLSLYGDGGLFCAFLALQLVESSLSSSHPKPLLSELNEKFCEIYCNHITSITAKCIIDVDFSDTSHLLTIVENILSSKPSCGLNAYQKKLLSILLFKAFLTSIPDSPSSEDKVLANVVFCDLDGESVEKCKLFDGILLLCPDAKCKIYKSLCHTVGKYAENTKDMKIVLFSTSLAGDADFPSKELYVSGISVWDAVLSYLKKLIARFLQDNVALLACQKVVHPLLKKQLEDENILVLERLGLDNTEYLHYVSGAIPVVSVSLSSNITYGYITDFCQIDLGKKKFFLLKNVQRPLQTVLLCNCNEESLSEMKIVCKQALGALYRLLKTPKACYGAGCTEIYAAAFLERTVKNNLREIACEINCSIHEVLEALENFMFCITEVAVSIHQDSRLSFASETVYHHLWKLEDGKFPAEDTKCMCGYHIASEIELTQWRIFERSISNTSLLDEECKPSENPSVSTKKPLVIDELSARVSAFRIACEVSSLLLRINLCILNQN